MQDIARLGVEVDGSDLGSGNKQLDKFAQTAERTEKRVSSSAKGMSGSLKGVGAASQSAAGATRNINPAARSAATGLDNFARSANAARFNTANLAAQGNDVIVMALAMQNPLQLALQQGTQVSQVFNQMGSRANIIKGLGAAFTSMINPVSLATIGIIAGGAALAQWAIGAMSAEEGVDDLKDAVEALTTETTEANDKLAIFARGLDNVAQLRAVEQIEVLQRQIAQTEAIASGGGNRDARNARGRLEVLREELRVLEEQLAARNRAVTAVEKMEAAMDLAAEKARSMQQSWDDAAAAQATAKAEAEAMLATMIEQNSIAAATIKYGEDSAQVADLRAAAERRAFEETLATMNITQDLKDELMGAFLIGQDIADTDVGAGIRGATADAQALAAQLGVSLSIASRMAALGNQGTKVYSGRGGDPRQFDDRLNTFETFDTSGAEEFLRNLNRGSRRSGGGGRSGKSEAQREAERQRNEDMRAAERIMNDLMTAQDQYNDALDQANRLYNAGVLPLQAYNDHVAKLREELIDEQWQNSGLSLVVDDMTEALSTARSVEEMFDNIGDAFRNMVQRSAAELINSGLTGLMQQAFGFTGGGGGGLLGSLFGGVGATVGGGPATQAIAALAGARANGGPVGAGQTYLVGERGPELFTPNSSGMVHSNADTQAMMNSGTQRVELVIRTDQGAVVQIVENTAGAMIVQNNKQLPSLMRQHEKRPHHR